MTDIRRPTHRGVTLPLAWTALLLTGVVLQGCGGNPATGAAGSRLRVYSADLVGGAKSCEVPKIAPAGGQTTDAAVKMTNDGGWCGLTVHQAGPKPYDAGLLTARPEHGKVLIHEVGDETRIDYTPDRGFAGNDSFSVKLLPGSAAVRVTVAVAAPGK
ncbi:MAG TPA: hypothetical protein DDZ81_25155 [Acetobacteraceae bacterium]|jgi:hypothetical protein|nr:hypothetical protein [Acetobacteraceae bacterium]